MPSQDISRIELHQASTTRARIIAQASDLVLQACGLDESTKPKSVQPEPAGRGNSPKTGTPATGGLDTVVEQFAVICFARDALLNSGLQFEQLVQEGRQLGLLRANPRLVLIVPQVDLSSYRPVPPDLPRQRPGHAPAAPRKRAPKPATRASGYPVQ